jgi:flavin reductase (DIM6/NTAB) family NADH-FMN oxidoreductase RutF
MIFTTSEMSDKEKKEILYKIVTPRPIGWIVTELDEVVNIAPFSFYNLISTKPPTVMVAIGVKPDGSPKDTLRNIRVSGKATICNVSSVEEEKMKQSGTSLEANESEAKKYGIELERKFDEFPPKVKSSSTALFCNFEKEMIGLQSKTVPLFLNVEKLFIADEVFAGKELVQLFVK